MARWMLIEPHYLKVKDTFWEQTEVDRDTGRPKRFQYPVPLHLDPKNPADWNYKPSGMSHITQGGNSFTDGAIIVCHEGKGEKKDYIFEGDPTPGMDPIDDEARAESAKFDWRDPIREAGMALDPSEKMLADLAKSVASALGQNADLAREMKEAVSMMAGVMAQNAQLIAALASNRRV
jgi:hypothetical protein